MDSHELLLGRPYGGCGILYRKSLSPYMFRLNCDAKRFCAVSLATDCTHSGSYNILIINVYLPTDYDTPHSNCFFGMPRRFISVQSICGDFNFNLIYS